MRSPAIAESHEPGEAYPEFTRRVAEDQARVDAKLAALDAYVPCCRYCGQTCNPEESGTTCKRNGMRMLSRWARELAHREWYRLGHFGGSWHNSEERLAALLDRVRAGVEDVTEGGK